MLPGPRSCGCDRAGPGSWGTPATLGSVKVLRLRHIQRPQHQAIHHPEHHSVCADGQRQRQHSGRGKSGRLAQLPQRKAHVGQDRLQRRPLPHLAAALLNQRRIAKCDARPPSGLLRAQAFAHELFHALFNMQVHLLGEVIVEFAATEDVRHPDHWNLLS